MVTGGRFTPQGRPHRCFLATRCSSSFRPRFTQYETFTGINQGATREQRSNERFTLCSPPCCRPGGLETNRIHARHMQAIKNKNKNKSDHFIGLIYTIRNTHLEQERADQQRECARRPETTPGDGAGRTVEWQRFGGGGGRDSGGTGLGGGGGGGVTRGRGRGIETVRAIVIVVIVHGRVETASVHGGVVHAGADAGWTVHATLILGTALLLGTAERVATTTIPTEATAIILGTSAAEAGPTEATRALLAHHTDATHATLLLLWATEATETTLSRALLLLLATAHAHTAHAAHATLLRTTEATTEAALLAHGTGWTEEALAVDGDRGAGHHQCEYGALLLLLLLFRHHFIEREFMRV